MLRSLIAAILIACAMPAASPAEPVGDYMVMDVCAGPDGAVLPGVTPLDAACTTRRKIRAGELPPYRLRDFPPQSGGCRDGLTVKYNVPVVRGAVTRVVSFTDRAKGGGCDGEGNAEAETARGLSVEWHDAEYGFIMASWSPVAMSSFEGPLCRTAAGDSSRFYRGWVIAAADVPPPGTAGWGQPGWGVFPSHLATGPAAAPADPCPARYNHGLTLWLTGTMAFGGGALPAIVSSHYARANRTGDAPGPAEQVERTYWTRAFGLTRWEKWAREDWSNPRSGIPAPALAATLVDRGRCNAPFALPGALTPRMQAGPLTGDGAWRQDITDPKTGERHGWVMTLCEDYTNVAHSPPSADAMLTAARVDDAYWRAPARRANTPSEGGTK